MCLATFISLDKSVAQKRFDSLPAEVGELSVKPERIWPWTTDARVWLGPLEGCACAFLDPRQEPFGSRLNPAGVSALGNGLERLIPLLGGNIRFVCAWNEPTQEKRLNTPELVQAIRSNSLDPDIAYVVGEPWETEEQGFWREALGVFSILCGSLSLGWMIVSQIRETQKDGFGVPLMVFSILLDFGLIAAGWRWLRGR